MSRGVPAVRPVRLATSPLRRLSLDPSHPDASLLWEWLPWRDEPWRQRWKAAFARRLHELSNVRHAALLPLIHAPDVGPLACRTPDIVGIPLAGLLGVHRHLAWRTSALVLTGALDAVRALHGAGLFLSYASPADLWLTTEGAVVVPHAGLTPLWLAALGSELTPASADWLQIFPEPRLQTVALLGGQLLDQTADRLWLKALLELLVEPRRPLPEGGVFALYRAIQDGTRRPPHPMPPEARAIWMLLDDARAPLDHVAARLKAEPQQPSAELRQRARPLSETLTQERSADGLMGPEVDVRALDLHVALGVPKRAPRAERRRRGWGRKLLWALLLSELLGLAASAFVRPGGCMKLSPGLDLDPLRPSYTPIENTE